MGNDRNVHRGETVQPGTQISKRLWSRFRDDVRDRRGRVNGVLADELERAIENYLDASKGRETSYKLEEIEERLESIEDAVSEGPAPSEAGSKNKKSSRKDPARSDGDVDDDREAEVATADGGVRVDDRHLYDEGEDDDRPVVERRTDAAVAELVATKDTAFKLDDLDEAIREGAGVGSKPSVRQYRERVIERIAETDPIEDVEPLRRITHPKHLDRPLESRVMFTDLEERDRIVETLREEQREEAEEEALEREEELYSAGAGAEADD